MNLVIDKGNTYTKVYIFEQGNIIHQEKYKVLDISTLEFLFTKYAIQKSIYSHVGNLDLMLCQYLEAHIHCISFNHLTSLPFKNEYKTPETLGLDRLALVAGAQKLYPNQPVLCIDLGTCITYDFIDVSGNYYGGAISPGLNMRLNALNTFTANLPLVSLEEQKPAQVGDSTFNSIRSGVYWGIYNELTGTINTYLGNHQNTKVLMCGGDLALFDTLIKNSIFARPDLVAEGLNTILEYNAQNIQ